MELVGEGKPGLSNIGDKPCEGFFHFFGGAKSFFVFHLECFAKDIPNASG